MPRASGRSRSAGEDLQKTSSHQKTLSAIRLSPKTRGTLVWVRAKMPSDYFANLVLDNCLDDFLRIFFPSNQCFGEVECLFQFYLAGQWWLILVYNGFDDHGTIVLKRLAKNTLRLFLIADGEALRTRGLRQFREVYWLKVNAELGIGIQDHLLPFNLSERIVLDNDDLHRQLVFHQSCHFPH